MKNKKILAILIILAIIFGLIYLIITIINPKPEQKIFDQPTGPVKENQNQQSQILKLTSVSPEESTEKTRLPIQAIIFTFSAPLDNNSISYQIDPDQKIKYQVNENKLIISPVDTWPLGLYTIKILPQTKSIYGTSLNKEIIYQIKIGYPDGV